MVLLQTLIKHDDEKFDFMAKKQSNLTVLNMQYSSVVKGDTRS